MRGPFSIPQGNVLKAFGITSSPTQLDGFTDIAQATLDLLPWFQQANRSFISQPLVVVNNTGTFFYNLFVPPVNKVWLVNRVSFRATTAADQNLRASAVALVAVFGANLAPFPVGRESTTQLVDVIGVGAINASNDRPFFLSGPNGDQCGIYVHSITVGVGGSIDTLGDIEFWEFDA